MIWRSTWVNTLPGNYIEHFIQTIHKEISYLSVEAIKKDSSVQDQVEFQAFGRMQQAYLQIVPWIQTKVDLKGANIVEIGAGTGSASAAMAFAGAHLCCIDVGTSLANVLLRRFELLNLPRPEMHVVDHRWLKVDGDRTGFETAVAKADAVIMYALVEHLMPDERVTLLRTLKKNLKRNAVAIVVEMPNRLSPIDWHTTGLLLPDVVDDETFLAYALTSPRGNVRKQLESRKPQSKNAQIELAYRAGRGVSFHEWVIAGDFDKLEIVQDGYETRLKATRDEFAKPNEQFEAGLLDMFRKVPVPIPSAFARPVIDMIFRWKVSGESSLGQCH